jgi:uncharacterized protein YjbJ (UPF0337 family)
MQHAVDAMPQGGTLTLRGLRTGSQIQLEVTDTGRGIPEDEVPLLFTPWHTTNPKGTGLGLCVVQEIMAAHEGTIAVRSMPGTGTTFIMTLPSAVTASGWPGEVWHRATTVNEAPIRATSEPPKSWGRSGGEDMAERQSRRGDSPLTDPETFASQWTQVRRELKAWWDQLTNDDLEKVAGQKDQLVALIQEKYRYTRERAQQEVDRRLHAYSDMLGASASRAADTVQTTAQDVVSSVAETASTVHATVADAVHGAGSYLHETPVKDLTGDLGNLVRRHPILSVLVGMGVGYFLARILGKSPTGPGA